jgi:DnaJ-domain-containing protein 1
MDFNQRLFRLLKSITQDKLSFVEDFINDCDFNINDRLDDWEKKYYQPDEDNKSSNNSFNEDFKQNTQSSNYKTTTNNSGFSTQLIDDLNLFNLKPPSNLNEIKKARNREMKKYHPDKFTNSPEKKETAKRIVQIYNEAYTRLKETVSS